MSEKMNKEKWQRIDVVFKLKSPLHIGYMTFGSYVVSPTRYYIPGRTLWGAITKIVTENLYEIPTAEDYKKIGKNIMDNLRFSYFYLYDEKTVYLPCYTDDGLMYGKKDKTITKFEFEHKFIGSRISTAIDGRSGIAKDESLHEIEFIHNKFKDEEGYIMNTKIVGIIWVKKDTKVNAEEIKVVGSKGIFIRDFNIIGELILGGESKYGFGDVLIDTVNKVKFPIEAEEGEISIKVNKGVPLPVHLKYHKNIEFKGDVELLSGRGHFYPQKTKDNGNDIKTSDKPGEIILKPKYYFSPGTVLIKEFLSEINWDGTLEIYKTET
jgi:hypothetical protein